MPRGILARYLHYVELMEKHGADLRAPHSEAMGGGLFELRPKASEGIGRVLYCTSEGRNNSRASFIRKEDTEDAEERT